MLVSKVKRNRLNLIGVFRFVRFSFLLTILTLSITVNAQNNVTGYGIINQISLWDGSESLTGMDGLIYNPEAIFAVRVGATPSTDVYNIISAIYGMNQTVNVTAFVQQKVNLHQPFRASNDMAGDPEFGTYKALTVVYSLNGGTPETVTYNEGALVTLNSTNAMRLNLSDNEFRIHNTATTEEYSDAILRLETSGQFTLNSARGGNTTFQVTNDGGVNVQGITRYPNNVDYSANQTLSLDNSGNLNLWGIDFNNDQDPSQSQTLSLDNSGNFNVFGTQRDENGNGNSGRTFSISNSGTLDLKSFLVDGMGNIVRNPSFRVDPEGMSVWSIQQNYSGDLISNQTLSLDNTGTLNVWAVQRDDDDNRTPKQTLKLDNEGLLSVPGTMAIGTPSTPAGYSLAVNGKGIFTKVRVKEYSSTNWSDYVFDDNYKLPMLSDVETFIKTKKHLPDIPTAEDVRKEGIDLGDNAALQLKKIEELTLYIIDQDHKSKNQEEEIKKQNQKIELLENQLEEISKKIDLIKL